MSHISVNQISQLTVAEQTDQKEEPQELAELRIILELVEFDQKSRIWARRLFPIILKGTTNWSGAFSMPKLNLDLVSKLLTTEGFNFSKNRSRNFKLIMNNVSPDDLISFYEGGKKGGRGKKTDIVFKLSGFLQALTVFRTTRSREVRKFMSKCTVGFTLFLTNKIAQLEHQRLLAPTYYKANKLLSKDSQS